MVVKSLKSLRILTLMNCICPTLVHCCCHRQQRRFESGESRAEADVTASQMPVVHGGSSKIERLCLVGAQYRLQLGLGPYPSGRVVDRHHLSRHDVAGVPCRWPSHAILYRDRRDRGACEHWRTGGLPWLSRAGGQGITRHSPGAKALPPLLARALYSIAICAHPARSASLQVRSASRSASSARDKNSACFFRNPRSDSQLPMVESP